MYNIVSTPAPAVQLKVSYLCHFLACRQLLSEELEETVNFNRYAASTDQLMTEFSTRFHDFRDKKELYAVFTDRLDVDVDSFPPEMQLEITDIQSCCSSLRAALREKGLIEFCKCFDVNLHPSVVANAFQLVSTFGSSYICDQAFTVMNLNKSKLRSRLTDDVPLAFSNARNNAQTCLQTLDILLQIRNVMFLTEL